MSVATALWVSEAIHLLIRSSRSCALAEFSNDSFSRAVGKNKKDAVKLYGKDQVKSWRRAYNDPPPPMEDNHEFHPALDPRYGHVSKDLVATRVIL